MEKKRKSRGEPGQAANFNLCVREGFVKISWSSWCPFPPLFLALVVFRSVVRIPPSLCFSLFPLSFSACFRGADVFSDTPFLVDFEVSEGVTEPYDVDLFEHDGDKSSVRRHYYSNREAQRHKP